MIFFAIISLNSPLNHAHLYDLSSCIFVAQAINHSQTIAQEQDIRIIWTIDDVMSIYPAGDVYSC